MKINYDELYPEHAKLDKIGRESQACGLFLEWVLGQYVLAQYHEHTDDCYIDGKKECRMSAEMLYPARIDINKLLAEHFGINPKRLEEEKDAMLRAIRAGVH